LGYSEAQAETKCPVAPAPHCHADRDGDCNWKDCPQEANNRANYQTVCPLYREEDESELAPAPVATPSLASLPRCPKCKSADIIRVSHKQNECMSCHHKFEHPVYLAPVATTPDESNAMAFRAEFQHQGIYFCIVSERIDAEDWLKEKMAALPGSTDAKIIPLFSAEQFVAPVATEETPQDELARMVNDLCEAISRIRWARGTDKLDAAIFEAVRLQGIADAGGYAKLAAPPPTGTPEPLRKALRKSTDMMQNYMPMSWSEQIAENRQALATAPPQEREAGK